MKMHEIDDLNLSNLSQENIEIDPTRLVVEDEFNKKTSGSYRDRAIQKLIDLKIPFASEDNIIFELVDKVLSVDCPYCECSMRRFQGSGNSSSFTLEYLCHECKAKLCLTLPCNGIGISPK